MAGPTNWQGETKKDQIREERRQARNVRINTRIEWFGDQLKQGVKMTMKQRVRIAAQLLRDKVVANISKPVTKVRQRRNSLGQYQRGRVGGRSRPGQYPRADTTRLMKDIFVRVHQSGRSAQVGTTLDYGLYLEIGTKYIKKRSYLRRTFKEFKPRLEKILGTDAAVKFKKV